MECIIKSKYQNSFMVIYKMESCNIINWNKTGSFKISFMVEYNMMDGNLVWIIKYDSNNGYLEVNSSCY